MSVEDVRMYGVLSDHIDRVWHEALPFLEKAIARSAPDKYHVDDIYKALVEKDMQLWVLYDNKGMCAIEITQIFNYPRKKVLMLVFTAGRESENWLPFVEILRQFAKEKGCVSLEGFGRPGWEKLSKPLGFKKISTLYQFDL